MDLKTARQKYYSQMKGAQRRDIGWRLTFKQWLEWWGSDIDRRGPHAGDLQMQRIADAGPYALGNIRKGTPKQNSRTMGLLRRTRNTIEYGRRLGILRDRDSGDSPAPDEMGDDTRWLEENLGYRANKVNLFEPKY